MNKKLIESVLEIARYYPSGDNSQPFRFRWREKDNVLLVDYIAAEAEHTLAYDEYTLFITLGAALEYIRNAFAIYDTNVVFNLSLNNFDVKEDHPAICSVSATDSPSILGTKLSKETLLNRVTDRRPYQPYESIQIDADNIQKSLRYTDCQLHINAATETLDFFALCDSMVWQSPTLGLDIMSTVTFSDPPAVTGLPWRNLGLKKAETYPIRLLQKYPWLFKVFKALGAAKAMQKSQRQLWCSSSSFLVFIYLPGLSNEEKILSNMELMNTLLTLSAQGYSFQPSTMSTDILNFPVKPTKNLQTAANLELDEIKALINDTREKLKLGNRQVNWILRCGKAHTPFPQNAHTLRLPVSELLSVEL